MTRKREDLTQAELKEHLHYDTETGIFTRLKSITCTVFIGDVAGSLNIHSGYSAIYVLGMSYRSHRLAWLYVYGKFPNNFIDHIDGKRNNNAIKNLRDVTCTENNQNKRECRDGNAAGFLGVTKLKSNRFKAKIGVGCIYHYLGIYDTPEEAHQAYLEAKRIHHSTCTI